VELLKKTIIPINFLVDRMQTSWKALYLGIILSTTLVSYNGIVHNSFQVQAQDLYSRPGIHIKYSLYFERILRNGDILRIPGTCTIDYINKVNESHIFAILDLRVDLSWIQGREKLDFLESTISREINIKYHQGTIIREMLAEHIDYELWRKDVHSIPGRKLA